MKSFNTETITLLFNIKNKDVELHLARYPTHQMFYGIESL